LTDRHKRIIVFWAKNGVSGTKIAKNHLQGEFSKTAVCDYINKCSLLRPKHVRVCPDCNGVKFQRAGFETVCTGCGAVLDHLPNRQLAPRDLEQEMTQNSPALKGAFGNGLGAAAPVSVVRGVVGANLTKPNGPLTNEQMREQFIKFREGVFNLNHYLDPRKDSPVENKLREILKKRIETPGLHLKHGDYDAVAALGLAVLKASGAKKTKIRLSELADACLLALKPDWSERLEKQDMRFKCPSCRKERSFQQQNEDKIWCLSCGKIFPRSKIAIKIRFKRPDAELCAVVDSFLRSRQNGQSRSEGRGSLEDGPTQLLDIEESKDV
jgi:ribosomal protein S27E